jgi:predicted MFS family arabinose efflux permease
MTRGTILLFAFCCGAIVANIYYAQPIIGLIAPDIHLSPDAASMIVSLTQAGYALGLFFLVPLGDLVENRKLTIVTVLISAASLATAACVTHPGSFLVISLLIGISSVSVQMLIPLAAHRTHDRTRGRVVGSIMSGLLLGILLARPLASVIADHFGWRPVFGMGAALMAAIALLLAITLPRRKPEHRVGYGRLLVSLGTLFLNMPILRQRAFFQACMFAAFSLFWTAVPLELMQRYRLSQTHIAIFALVGATGAIAAPISGRLADAGYTRMTTRLALLGGAVVFLPSVFIPTLGVIGLALTGIVLDFSVQMNMVLGQREIYALDARSLSRLNGLYVASIFTGGAIGSAMASAVYAQGGWSRIALTAGLFPLAALIRFLSLDRAVVS